MALRDFVESWHACADESAAAANASDPRYHFRVPSAGIADEWSAADAELPWFHEHTTEDDPTKYFAHDQARRRQRALWFLGPPHSGPFFHVHPAAYNALLYGERRCFLSPPHGLQRPPSVPMPQWVSAYDRKVRGLEDKDGLVWEAGWGSIAECVQEGGDVIYIPDGWNHAVLNTQESVGIAIELGDNVQLWEAVRGLAQ